MTSTVTRSQSNRAPLGCGGTGGSHHGLAADNLQQLHDAIMSIWTKSLRNFYILVESMQRRIKAVLKAKGCPTRGTSKSYIIKWPVNVCTVYIQNIYIYIYIYNAYIHRQLKQVFDILKTNAKKKL